MIWPQRRFVWNEEQARSNILRHHVSSEEARQVYDDARTLVFFDAAHSDSEDRFVLLGVPARLRILFVVHAEAQESSPVSSAPAERRAERRAYEENLKEFD